MAQATSQPLEPGVNAPNFSGPASNGTEISLKSLKGKYVVLYFYPKDNTPGCTVEAKEFRDVLEELEAVNATVLGVSPDSIESHCRFTDRFELNFPLIADEDHSIAESYGVWVEKNMYGKKYMGIQRATFLIDPKGVLTQIWAKVRPEGHGEQVLKAIQALQG